MQSRPHKEAETVIEGECHTVKVDNSPADYGAIHRVASGKKARPNEHLRKPNPNNTPAGILSTVVKGAVFARVFIGLAGLIIPTNNRRP